MLGQEQRQTQSVKGISLFCFGGPCSPRLHIWWTFFQNLMNKFFLQQEGTKAVWCSPWILGSLLCHLCGCCLHQNVFPGLLGCLVTLLTVPKGHVNWLRLSLLKESQTIPTRKALMCRTPHSALLALTGSLALPSLIWTPASVPERCVTVRKGAVLCQGVGRDPAILVGVAWISAVNTARLGNAQVPCFNSSET